MVKSICPICLDTYTQPKASDTLTNSSDTANTTQSATYVKVKEISLPTNFPVIGVMRVKFTLATNDATNNATGRIYIDGVATGAEQTTNSTTGVEFSEDVTIPIGASKIQIYAKIANVAAKATVSNFRIYNDLTCLCCGYDDSMKPHSIWE